jgi:PAS domain S-box-containing protein
MILRKLLGEIMASMGFLTRQQLNEALRRQKEVSEGKRLPERVQRASLVSQARVATEVTPSLGQILLDMGFATREQLEQALKQQEEMAAVYSPLRSEKLGASIEIASIVNSTLDLSEVLARIMRYANRVTDSVASTLMLRDDNTGELVFSVPTGPQADRLTDMRLAPGKGIAGWVVEHEQPLLIPDVRKDPRFYRGIDKTTGFETKSILCVPLKAKTRLIGVLEAINKVDGTSFTEEDQLLLSIFAYQAAMAIENARLYGELKDRLEETEQMRKKLEQEIIERKYAEEEVRRTKRELETIMDSVPATIVFKDRNNRYVRINKTYSDMVNLQRTDIEGKSAFDIATNRELAEKFWRDDKEVMASGIPKRNIIQPLITDKTRWLQTDKIPYRDEKGHIKGVIGFGIEITWRLLAEEALRESEERYRSLIENLPIAVCRAIPGPKGKFLMANPTFLKMFGLESEEDLKRMTVAEVYMNPEDRKAFSDNLLTRGKVEGAELPLRKKDGTVFWGSVTATVACDESGNNFHSDCTIMDVTERKRAEEALRASEERLKVIIENVRDVIFQLTPFGFIQYVSPNVEELYGYTPEELIGKHLKKTTPVTELPRALKAIERVVSGKEIRNIQINQLDGRGKTIPTEVNLNPVKKGDKIIAVQGIMRDVTERKRAEDALRESYETLVTVLNSIEADVYACDLENYKILFVNKRMQDSFGKDLVGEQCYQVFRGKKKPCGHCTNERLLDTNREPTGFVVWEGRNPLTKRWYRNYDKAIKWIDGGLARLQVAMDITDLRRAEKKIQEYSTSLERMVEERTQELNEALSDAEQARDRIDGILKSVGDGLIVTDIYNRVILMNRAAERLLGARLSEVIERPIDFAIEDKTLREQIKTTLDKKETGYQIDFELRENGNKPPRTIRARTSVIEDKDGKQTGIVTIMHDVTYEREVDRMKTEFISTAAHELRTPLTSIQGFSEILSTRDDIEDEEKRKFLTYISKQSVNLGTIISNLLDISRIESGRELSLHTVPGDIADIIRSIVPYFQDTSPGYSFEIIVPEEPMELCLDREKVGRVLENILSNAVKYSPGGGVIRISGRVIQDHYQVSVEDQGIGMSREQWERIFDKFYRADTSNTAIPGTGLGMSIVKYLVEAHGGKVWVESELAKGTTVHFTLPLDKQHAKGKE